MRRYDELDGKAVVVTLTSGVRFIGRYCGYDEQDDYDDVPIYDYYEFQALKPEDPHFFMDFETHSVASIEKYEEGMKFFPSREKGSRVEENLEKAGFIIV